MSPAAVNAILWLAAIVAFIILLSRQRRRHKHVGSAAAGSVYDMLHADKRNAVEIVVEERAGARDPEDRDGNLPNLENPTAPRRER